MALRPRHIRRYRQITEVLTRHGFGAIVAQLGLQSYLDLPNRLLRRKSVKVNHKTPAQHMVLALEELGPTFIKLGQLLSTRSDLLPPTFITELSRLQDDVAPVPWPEIKTTIQAELGRPIEQLFETYEERPIAGASLAQVHVATLFTGEEVIVKVQRPGIERTIDLDLDILYDMAQLAQQRTTLGKRYQSADLAEEFGSALQAELDFRREGRNADRFRASFADEPHLHVPQIYWEYTTRRVMVQERLTGIKVDNVAALDAAGYDRSRLAAHSARIILKEVLEDGFFHADPHPGNIVVLPNEVIGLLDFGTVGHLAKADRANLIRLFVGAVQLDVDGVVEQLVRMEIADYSVDQTALRRDLRRVLLRYHGVPLEDISASEILDDLEPIIFRYQLRIPTDLWLLIKTMVIMEGVGQVLDPDFDLFEAAKPFVRRFMLRSWLPSEWGPSVLRSTTTLADLLIDLPRQTTRILGQVERGELGVQIGVPELEQTTRSLEGIANRIILGVLLAAVILGLALLIPNLDLSWPWNLLTWIIMLTFGVAVVLAMSLIWSIFRSATR